MQFSAWDPDRYFTRIYPHLRWIYTSWFTTFTLVLFAFMLILFAANWSQIARDTLQFYTFTEKSAGDLAQFWILFLILGFLHESSHGLTCKHYGAEVHAMGFHLIFLTPAFFVDVSEAWVYASRWQRFITILAGVWSEMIVCSIATFIWWGTPAGSNAHDVAYKVMLLTGVAVVVVNMNPPHQARWILCLLRDHRLLRYQGKIDRLISPGWCEKRSFDFLSKSSLCRSADGLVT